MQLHTVALLGLAAFAALVAAPTRAAAQDAPAPTVSDRAVNPAQPDFTLVALPTTLRVPRFGSSFRVTHRFTRALGSGTFSNLASDLFGLDSGAQVGLEYRFGIVAGTQVGVHRTSDRTVQFLVQHQLFRQDERWPVGIDVVGSAEGTNNFRDTYSPAVGAVISRTLGRAGALYAHPIWIHNTNPLPSDVVQENDTFLLGFGARLRVRPSVYLVGEAAPRVGHSPGVEYVSFAIERRAGGHSFQLNFSNGFGTTLGQLAQGGISDENWYIGFNISRKFF